MTEELLLLGDTCGDLDRARGGDGECKLRRSGETDDRRIRSRDRLARGAFGHSSGATRGAGDEGLDTARVLMTVRSEVKLWNAQEVPPDKKKLPETVDL